MNQAGNAHNSIKSMSADSSKDITEFNDMQVYN